MARTGSGRRAGGAPIGDASAAIASIIEARARSVTVERPTTTTGPLDETEVSLSPHTEQIWLHSTSETTQAVDSGERAEGDLGGLALDGIDVQREDRITYGGVEYEVDTVVGRPEDADADGTTHDNTNYFTLMLVRRQ